LITAEVKGLDRRRSIVLARFKAIQKANIRDANEKNADEFASQVVSAISHTSAELPAAGHVPLEQTVRKEQFGEVGFRVSIGGPQAPYPLHLDAGHMASDGKHVPAQPFWWVTLRLLGSRFRSRRNRAQSAALKAFARDLDQGAGA
jgi:hypothetical protein